MAAVNYFDILERGERGERRMVAVPSEGKPAPIVYAAALTAEAKRRSTRTGEAKMKGKKGKKKAKLSKAARAEISRKNLAKARRAKKAKAYTGARPHKGGKSKAKGKTKWQKLSPKQRAAALSNLQKARMALAKKKKGKAVRAPKMPKHAPVRQAARRGGKKRKLTKAERATISRRNLKKARAAQKRGGSHKRSKGKRKGKLTKAQRRAINMKNLRKARAARARSKKAGRKHPVEGYKYPVKSKTVRVPAHKSWEGKGKRRGQSRKQRAASLRNLKKARAAQRRGGGSRAAEKAGKRKGGKKRRSAAQKAASMANLKKAVAARKKATKRHPVKSYSYHRQGGQRRVPAHMSYEYAMENPFTVKEFGWGVGTGLVYFLAVDGVDRFWATHALTSKGTTDASGHALYADTPITTPTFWTGYANAYNPTAICAPMNLVRWGSGIVLIAAPLVGARFVENPFWRSQLQVAGFAATVRIGGKALIDLIAKIAMWTKTGQRLYDGEMRAAVLTSTDQSALTSLPASGLGAVGCGACPSCRMGVGSCGAMAGVGWPSMPREAAAPSSPTATTPSTSGQPVQATPPPPVPPPQSPATTPEPGAVSPLQGVSGLPLLPPRKNVYDWGHKEEVGEEAA